MAQLDLTAEQQSGARAILEKYRPALEKVFDEAFPRAEALRNQMDDEVRALLTTEQQTRFDDLRRRRMGGPGEQRRGMGPGRGMGLGGDGQRSPGGW